MAECGHRRYYGHGYHNPVPCLIGSNYLKKEEKYQFENSKIIRNPSYFQVHTKFFSGTIFIRSLRETH